MYVIALDQGTTSSRAVLFDKNQKVVAIVQKEIKQFYPKDGYVEQDPMEIWTSQYGVLLELITKSAIDASMICALGITNQRETTIIWDKHTGLPIYNAIVWQCRRTSNYCEQLKKAGHAGTIRDKTGLVLDAYFSATKIKWILDNVKDARRKAKNGDLLFGTVDSWLLWKLTGVHATDKTNASRTMLYNIYEQKWDSDLLSLFNIPENILPVVQDSSHHYASFSLPFSPHKIPITGIAGDQQAALFGQCCFGVGDTKTTYGTGCFMLMNTGRKAIKTDSGILTTIAIAINGKIEYALEGSVFMAGATISWLKDGLGLINNSAESDKLASSVENTGGVYLVPAFVGMGTPYWDSSARGILIGLTQGSKKEHIVRASLESIAYQTKDILDVMESESKIKIKKFRADGGASANHFLMQFQANILKLNVEVADVQEVTALGAAFLAGLHVGFWKNKIYLQTKWKWNHSYRHHNIDVKSLYKGWKKAVSRALNWLD